LEILKVSSERDQDPVLWTFYEFTFTPNRVRNCAFLVANATENFALVTRISQLVASGQLTTLFHATIASIFSQIDQNKIQSCPPIGDFLFTFLLLWKYKTDFLLL